MARDIISSIFSRSPIEPLQIHMSKVYECVELLRPFMETAIDDDWAGVKTVRKEIAKQERSADSMKRKLRKQLPTSTFLPVPRAELLDVLRTQDNIANIAKDAVVLVQQRHQAIPQTLAELLLALVDLAIDAAKQAHTAIHELDELVEVGFRGKAVKRVEKMLMQLDKIESKSDQCQSKSHKALQKLEAELPPIDVVFLYKLIDLLASVADESQRVGARLQIMLAR